MDALQFAYWLQGFAELSGDTPPTEAQWKSIREHIALVFQKVTPPLQIAPNRPIPNNWPPIDLSNPKCGEVLTTPARTPTRC